MTTTTPLEAREQRWNRKCALAKSLGISIVSITLNVPHSVKTETRFLALHQRICAEFTRYLQGCFGEQSLIQHEEGEVTSDGAYLLLGIREDAQKLKQLAVTFEEQKKVYRLADIDVMTGTGEMIGRQELGLPMRRCYLCEDDAKLCIVSRKHSAEEVLAAVERLADNTEDKLKKIADCALKGILYEVAAAPKPGLVTSNDSGSHSDMDIFTFIDSALAIAPYFYTLAKIGADSKNTSNDAVMEAVRACGLRAEQAMFRATAGVNTHKGMIFAMGMVCVCAGICLANGEDVTSGQISIYAKALLHGITEQELLPLKALSQEELQQKKLSHGEKLYLKYGVTGARGEAEQGFPTCMSVGLPALRHSLTTMKENDALVQTLLTIMTEAEDTNVLSRSGREGLLFVRKGAKEILALGGMTTEKGRAAIAAFDTALKEKSISSGGAADMLALTTGIFLMENLAITGE